MPITAQSIKDATQCELEKMQEQLQLLQENISAQLRARTGDRDSARDSSKTLEDNLVGASENPKQHTKVSDKYGDNTKPCVAGVNAVNHDDDPTESVELPIIQNGASHKLSTDSKTSDFSEPDDLARISTTEEALTENACARDAMVQSTVDKAVEQKLEAALTPPADITKDGAALSNEVTAVKPKSNDAETPETIIADPATSPPETDTMDLDECDRN